MRFIFQVLCLAIASISIDVQATSLEQAYVKERNRLFSLSFTDRGDALAKSSVFDRETPLGEYFYKNVHYYTVEDKRFFGLQGESRKDLEQTHPFFYVEMLLEEVDRYAENASENYTKVIQEAKSKGYSNLARAAAYQSANALFDDGKLVDAIAALEPVLNLSHAQSEHAGYSIVTIHDIFLTLASIYMLLGEFDVADDYCAKSSTSNDITTESYQYARMCEANSSYYAGNPQKTLDIVYPLIDSKGSIQVYDVYPTVFWLIARANNQLGLYNDALEYGLIGLEKNDEPNSISVSLGLIYSEIVKSYVGLGDKINAAVYANKLEEAIQVHDDVPFTYRKFLDAKSLNQELQGDFQGAYTTLNEILEIDKELKRLNANKSSVIDTISGLSNTRVKYLETTAANAKTHQFQRNIAITLSFGFCIFCLFVYWRKQHKLKALANVVKHDASTGLNSYGYSLLALANAQDASSLTPTSLVLVRLNNLTLLAKQKSVNHVKQSVIELAKYLNSALPDTFTIGRYSQDTFIVVLPKTFTVEAEHVIRDILKPYCNESLIEDNIISVSAAILEITAQDAIEHVLIQCEDLLTQNPSTGEVIVKTSKYSAKPTNEAVA